MDDDAAVFEVDGVAYKAQSNYLITIGTNVPKRLRGVVKMRNNEDREAAVRRHASFSKALTHLKDQSGELLYAF